MTMSKRNPAATWTTDTDTSAVTVTLATGQVIETIVNNLPPEMIVRLAMHGFEQKVRDSYAGAKEAVEEGRAATVIDYVSEQIMDTIAMIESGTWARRATGDGGDLAKAISEVMGKDRGEVAAKLKTMTDEEKAAAKSHPKVKAALARYRAEREAAKAATLEGKTTDGDEEVPGF
jgi:hypothetical protein